MIVPSLDFIVTYAKSQGVYYLYDANHDGQVDTTDVQLLKQAQSATDYHMKGWQPISNGK